MKRAWLPAGLLALCAAVSASAQTVYRCGPDGSDYRQTPCPGGQAVNVADPRSDAQRSEAAQRALRDAQLSQEQPAQSGTATSQPMLPRKQAQPTAERRPAARQHGKRHRDLPENARLARAPAGQESKPAKPAKQAKAQP
jgi:hypothetical protein